MPITFTKTHPVFRIFDVPKAKDFYLGFLGFKTDWEHRFEPDAPVYMQVSRGEVAIHLSEHHGDACPGATVFFWMTGIHDYHREITAKGYRFYRPAVEQRFEGMLTMKVQDPFGNNILFNERVEKQV